MKRALVDYMSSSDSETEAASGPSTLPALPKALEAAYAVAPRKGQDPAFHDGRQRQVKHTAGLWPTHIQLDVRLSSLQRGLIESLLESVRHITHVRYTSLLVTSLGVEADLHISLSRSFMLSGEDKESFQEAMRVAIKGTEHKTLHFVPTGVAVFPSDDGQRFFPVLQGRFTSSDSYTHLMSRLQPVLDKYNVAPLYESKDDTKSLHISIGWTTSAAADTLSKRQQRLLQDDSHLRQLQAQHLECAVLRIKVGNELHLETLGK